MMKVPLYRSIVTLALLPALFVSCGMAKTTLAPSVLPLQHEGRTFCTAFAINEAEHLWLTARHCAIAALENQWDVTIDGDWAVLVYMAPGMDDLAVFQAAHAGHALELSTVTPQVGDGIRIQGYPFGILVMATTHGFVAGRMLPVDGAGVSDLLDITVAPGNSGSPVLSHGGKVIGVLWGHFAESEYSLSTPWEVVKRLVGKFFQ